MRGPRYAHALHHAHAAEPGHTTAAATRRLASAAQAESLLLDGLFRPKHRHPSDPASAPMVAVTSMTASAFLWQLPEDQGHPPAAYGVKCVLAGQGPDAPVQGVSPPSTVGATSGVVTGLEPGGSYTCAPCGVCGERF